MQAATGEVTHAVNRTYAVTYTAIAIKTQRAQTFLHVHVGRTSTAVGFLVIIILSLFTINENVKS